MKKWHWLLCLYAVLLTGCAKGVYINPPANNPSDDASIKIAEAANSISHSMNEMAEVEKVIAPISQDDHRNIPSTYNLQARASVDWSGPIEELTNRVARAAHYRLHVFGKEPAVPVLISLNVKDESLVQILRDIDYQAGKKASIRVYPNNQIVELRYAKIYS